MAPDNTVGYKVREEAGPGTGDRVVVDHTGERYRLVPPGYSAPYVLLRDGRIVNR